MRTSFGLGLVAAALISTGIHAQPATKLLQFEAASVKPSDPSSSRGPMYFTNLAGDLIVRVNQLRAIIVWAHQIPESRMSGGPQWIYSERYDIDAKVERTGGEESLPGPNEMTDDQRHARAQRNTERVCVLLAQMFALVAHRETKELPVFELTVAGKGPNLKPVEQIGDKEGTGGGRGRSQGFSAPIDWLATALSDIAGRPVINKTGLDGRYDWLLEWTPNLESAGQDGGNPAQTAGLFTALREQLGLQLKAARGPVEIVVIDQVQKLLEN